MKNIPLDSKIPEFDHDVKFQQDSGWIGTRSTVIYANDTSNKQTSSNVFDLTVTSSKRLEKGRLKKQKLGLLKTLEEQALQ